MRAIGNKLVQSYLSTLRLFPSSISIVLLVISISTKFLLFLSYHLHISNCFLSFLTLPLLILLLSFFGFLLTQNIAYTCTPHRPHRYDPTSTPIDPICCLLRSHMNSKSTSGPSYIKPTSNPQTPHRPSHCRLHVDPLILTRRRERRKESDRNLVVVFLEMVVAVITGFERERRNQAFS